MMENLVRERSAFLAALSTVLVLSVAAPALAAGHAADANAIASVPDGNVKVEVVAINGSGCPSGDATVIANADKTGFRIRYHNFEVEASPGSDPKERRKNCQVGVEISAPAGWTFAIAEAEYRGVAQLYRGGSGLNKTNYYWQGSSENNRTEERFAGPLSGRWSNQDEGVLVFGPCSEQRILNVNTELRVDNGTSSLKNRMSMKSSEGDVDTLFNLGWARC